MPTSRPSGWSIRVRTALTFVPRAVPIPTIVRASSRAWSSSFMKAPDPTFTSRTSPSRPSASFFDMIDDEMSGIDGTVPVASRRA